MQNPCTAFETKSLRAYATTIKFDVFAGFEAKSRPGFEAKSLPPPLSLKFDVFAGFEANPHAPGLRQNPCTGFEAKSLRAYAIIIKFDVLARFEAKSLRRI